MNNSKIDKGKVVVATKGRELPNKMVETATKSCERLGINKIPLYQLHGPLDNLSRQIDGLAAIVKNNLTWAIGVCNFSADQLKFAHKHLLTKHNLHLGTCQNQFSLLHQNPINNGVLQTCKDLGIVFLSYSPLAQGRLTGKYSDKHPPKGTRGFGKVAKGKLDHLILEIKKIGEECGSKSVAQICLKWLIQHGAVPIPGAKTLKQIKDNNASV